LDIGLWHRLAINPDTGGPYLSSRRLLVILEGLPEKSRFKTALRDGRWPSWQRMLAELANEAYRFRSSFQAANSEEGKAWFDTTDVEFVDPVDRAERARRDAADVEAAKTAQARFEAAIGFC